jgi:hypothetical protein
MTSFLIFLVADEFVLRSSGLKPGPLKADPGD